MVPLRYDALITAARARARAREFAARILPRDRKTSLIFRASTPPAARFFLAGRIRRTKVRKLAPSLLPGAQGVSGWSGRSSFLDRSNAGNSGSIPPREIATSLPLPSPYVRLTSSSVSRPDSGRRTPPGIIYLVNNQTRAPARALYYNLLAGVIITIPYK